MRFPTIAVVASSLRDISTAAAKDTRVILRVAPDGSWAVQGERETPKVKGGHLAAAVVPAGNGKPRRFASTELARDLIRDVKDAYTARARAEKEAKAAEKLALREATTRRRRVTKEVKPPFRLGTRVTSAGLKGIVVGHAVVNGQLGPVHVHLIQVDNPVLVAQWETYVSIVTIADDLLRLDMDELASLAAGSQPIPTARSAEGREAAAMSQFSPDGHTARQALPSIPPVRRE